MINTPLYDKLLEEFVELGRPLNPGEKMPRKRAPRKAAARRVTPAAGTPAAPDVRTGTKPLARPRTPARVN